ncbi:MAG TPA: 6-phosphogluconolactonase [Ohtaekwangia sp.]|uniref:6-phosphogluconolactonase n=1 Tax=Ohtaekwangia sp. TaxID=2066019 RepID=UPI002F92C16F
MIHVFETPDILLTALADQVTALAKEAIQKEGRFSFVLSGGSSPKKLFELLASDIYRNKIEWSKVFFFFGDERYVPADHPDSNFLMAKKALFDALNISEGQIFRMKTELEPEQAAQAYEDDLLAYFGDKPVRFDLVLLGLGDDAHTASLFPGTTVIHEKESLVKALYIDKVKMYRITITAPCINQAAVVAFLVYGPSKAEALHHVLEGEQDVEKYPAQLIRPNGGMLHWYLDQSAARQLNRK